MKNTKIREEMEPLLDAACEKLGTNIYDLLQMFCYTIIRATSLQHPATPEIRKILTMMENDSGWQSAFNLANPAKMKVAQAVLILEQEGRKGFGAVMVDRPWMGNTRQTECVDDILERVIEVTMHGIYRRLKVLCHEVGSENMMDVLMTMTDASIIEQMEENNRAEIMRDMRNNIADNGRGYQYGNKAISKPHKTVDSAAQQRIVFDDYDASTIDNTLDNTLWRDLGNDGGGDGGDAVTDALGCKPFDVEP